MTTRNLIPLGNYPTGVYSFGPYAVQGGALDIDLIFARCTPNSPGIWPNSATLVNVVMDGSNDGGNTYTIGQWTGGPWRGAVLRDKVNNLIGETIWSVNATPAPTHVKGYIQVTSGPVRTKLDMESP